MAHEPKKLTLADFTFPSGGLVAPPGMEFHKISDGFWTCGAGCPHPRECLANEHCERGFVGFVGNAVGFTGGMEVSPRDAARALEVATLSADGLAAAHTKLGAALEETGAALEAEQYVKRDAAWQAYFTEHDLRNRGHNSMVVAGMHDAFDAGWAARKKAELEMAFGLDKPKAE